MCQEEQKPGAGTKEGSRVLLSKDHFSTPVIAMGTQSSRSTLKIMHLDLISRTPISKEKSRFKRSDT